MDNGYPISKQDRSRSKTPLGKKLQFRSKTLQLDDNKSLTT